MAGMLTNKKELIIIEDPYAFLNAIRLIVSLITGKWVNFNFIALTAWFKRFKIHVFCISCYF